MPWHSPVVIQDVRPEIIDARLTLISMTGQGACGLVLFLQRQPQLLLSMDATMQPAVC
jgi:hypothetical protein